ncbi:MAG: hypothetical protein ACLP0J_04100 [Solirubrobacteraceae bacterium]
MSEIRRGRDQHVRAWAGAVDDIELHLSVLTLGEIRKGIELLRGSAFGASQKHAGLQELSSAPGRI